MEELTFEMCKTEDEQLPLGSLTRTADHGISCTQATIHGHGFKPESGISERYGMVGGAEASQPQNLTENRHTERIQCHQSLE